MSEHPTTTLESSERNSNTVLVIDDNQIKRYTTSRILERHGFSVTQAVSGMQGLLLALDRPDLIILDVRLPDIDGFEVCRRIKSAPETSGIPVLHLSAHRTSSRDMVSGLEGGADGYLTVPAEPQVIIATVRALLRLHNAEEAAKAAVRYWQATFDAIGDAVFLTDDAGSIMRCNLAAAALFDTTVEHLIGHPLTSMRERLGLEGGSNRTKDSTPTVEESATKDLRWFRIVSTAVGANFGGMVCIFTDVTQRVEAELERAAIASRNENIAEALQRSLLLTPDANDYPGLEIASIYRPASQESLVGGDFNDIFPLANDLVALVVGDVTGKGLKAATFTAEIKFVLRAFLRESPDPDLALSRLNRYLMESQVLVPGNEHTYVSMTIAIASPTTGRIVSSSAGAEPPLVLRRDGTTLEIEAIGPLIAMDIASHFRKIEAQFFPGDIIAIATDGITEARDGNQFFGLDGLSRAGHAAAGLSTLHEMALSIVESALHLSSGRQKDDICLILVRCSEVGRNPF